MRLALAPAVAVLVCGCGLLRVDDRAVARLPLESKLDLIEAENDLFIAVDATDEAASKVLETREDYRKADTRIAEAHEALNQAEAAGDSKLIEIGKLSIQESKERKDFLEAHLDVAWAELDVEKAKLELARARYERARAQVVKKANVEGAQAIKLEAFDKQVADLEATVKNEQERKAAQAAAEEKIRSRWYATKLVLASKTGGAQGSPWVE